MIYVFLTLLALVYLLPLIWVFITSLKDDAVLMISPWALPERPMFENYAFAWTMGNLGKATLNSLSLFVLPHLFCLWRLVQWQHMQLLF